MAIDVALWLRGLGLEQYAPGFADNDIDAAVLPELTSEDLIALGVTSIGHRRRLFSAIAALRGPPPEVVAPAPTALTAIEAERRQLTVMFCDLVGSTPLASRFDPEDLRPVIGAYHRAVAKTVDRFAGFVAKYMGDGVLVYFGYPQAHEDDAERAVRAGLAVIEAVGRLNLQAELAVRIGIATGLVVVGDLIGAGVAQEHGVVGETPNLAARLQALAQPGTLIIADATRKQLGALFEVEDLGPQALTGFAAPQRAWRVIGESVVVSRFEALRSGATPLVGRDEELDLLRRRWQQAKQGEGRAVLLSGDPGIGKSRLTTAIAGAVEADLPVRLRWFCSPHHQDSALYPFIVQLEHAAGFARQDAAEEKLEKLKSVLAPGRPANDEFALLSELLSLPNGAADLPLSPQRKREKLFEALTGQLAALSRARPVLATFEDAHWIDPTSRELLDLMVEQVRRLPVLLVITFRPEFQHSWGGRAHVTTLMLNRLGEREAATLVRSLAGNAPLGGEVVEEIVERTDGVPLFVEELTKAVLERADQDNRVAGVMSASPQPALAVPFTLHASLIARLDRIGATAREVAQIGTVLGREFSYELIAALAQRSEAELQTALVRLSEVGLLFCRGTPPHATYQFKHALVQDTAYGTLLRARRQELHARVAAALAQQFADLVDRQPELLAHHLSAAGDIKSAVTQWLRAGRHAAARSANKEAVGHFDRGLGLLPALSDPQEHDRCEIELLLAKGGSLITIEGFASTNAGEAYQRAQQLAETRGDVETLVIATFGLWNFTRTASFDRARALSARMIALTRNLADDGMRLQAHHTAWTTGFFGGEPATCHAHAQEGRRLYDFERHRSYALLFGGHDPGVCARTLGGWSGWLLGHADQGLGYAGDALELATRLAHPYTLALVRVHASIFHQLRREPELVLQHLRGAEALVDEQRLALPINPLILRGSALVAQGHFGEAVRLLRDGLTNYPAGTLYRPYCLLQFAEALHRSGVHDEALAVLAEAEATATKTGEHWSEAEIQRVKGLVLLSDGNLADSEHCFEQAIQIARRQQAKALELRACMSLARLLGEHRRRTEAQELLAPVYRWFTEGFDTADLREAAALLAELA